MSNVIGFDIETIPSETGLPRMLAKLGEDISAPSNWKDAEKIAAHIAAKKAALEQRAAKEASLNPIFGMLASAALWSGREGAAFTLHDMVPSDPMSEQAERALLELVCVAMSSFDPSSDTIATFGGKSFDAQFLAVRCLVHRMAPPPILDLRRYSSRPHLDCRAIIHGWDDHARGNLADTCEAFNVPCSGKDMGVSGGDVFRLAMVGQWDTIAAYNLGDAQAAQQLGSLLLPLVALESQGRSTR